MNFRGYAAYTDYMQKKELSRVLDTTAEEEDNSNYYTSNSSEEENQNSSSFEILEKLNIQERYTIHFLSVDNQSSQIHTDVLDLYSMLKSGLNTPPPEFV